MSERSAGVLEQFRDRRSVERVETAEQAIAVFDDGTRVPCIIHDLTASDAEGNLGLRVELINCPGGQVPDTFSILRKSGAAIRYSPGWRERL